MKHSLISLSKVHFSLFSIIKLMPKIIRSVMWAFLYNSSSKVLSFILFFHSTSIFVLRQALRINQISNKKRGGFCNLLSADLACLSLEIKPKRHYSSLHRIFLFQHQLRGGEYRNIPSSCLKEFL